MHTRRPGEKEGHAAWSWGCGASSGDGLVSVMQWPSPDSRNGNSRKGNSRRQRVRFTAGQRYTSACIREYCLYCCSPDAAVLIEGHHYYKPGPLPGWFFWLLSVLTRGVPWWHPTMDSSVECELGCDGPSEGTRGGQEAPPRLSGTRLAWNPLWRSFWPAGGPKMNIYLDLWGSYIRGF